MKAIILVGHGGVPSDFPKSKLKRLRELEARRSHYHIPCEEETNLDFEIRNWPRTAEIDPYQVGVKSIAAHLAEKCPNHRVAVAYNEFCAPTIAQSAAGLVDTGVQEITVISTMLTPGGNHTEHEIPHLVDQLKKTYPDVRFIYAWPFDLDRMAQLLADQVERFEKPKS